MTNLIGGHLIDRNAGVNIGPGRFANAHAGEERAVGAGMITGAVGAGCGIDVIQAAQHLHVLLQILQRLHRVVEFEIGPLVLRPPSRRDGAVGKVHKSHPHRRASGGRCQRRAGLGFRRLHHARQQRFERRQRHAGAQPPQKAATIEAGRLPERLGSGVAL